MGSSDNVRRTVVLPFTFRTNINRNGKRREPVGRISRSLQNTQCPPSGKGSCKTSFVVWLVPGTRREQLQCRCTSIHYELAGVKKKNPVLVRGLHLSPCRRGRIAQRIG